MPLHFWKNPHVAWKGFHNLWIAQIVEYLNEVLPPGFQARPTELVVGIEPDVLLTQREEHPESAVPLRPQPALMEATLTAVIPPPTDPPLAGVYSDYDVSRLVAAMEVLSPSNKQGQAETQNFVGKAHLLLKEGVHFMVVDVLSDPARPIRKPLLEHLGIEASVAEDRLWISSYATEFKEDPQPHIIIHEWARDLAVGDSLPTLPLFLHYDDLWVNVDLETTYQETLRAGRYRLA